MKLTEVLFEKTTEVFFQNQKTGRSEIKNIYIFFKFHCDQPFGFEKTLQLFFQIKLRLVFFQNQKTGRSEN